MTEQQAIAFAYAIVQSGEIYSATAVLNDATKVGSVDERTRAHRNFETIVGRLYKRMMRKGKL